MDTSKEQQQKKIEEWTLSNKAQVEDTCPGEIGLIEEDWTLKSTKSPERKIQDKQLETLNIQIDLQKRSS